MSKLMKNPVGIALEELDPVSDNNATPSVKGEQDESKLITMDGPLSVIFAKALNEAYAKDKDVGTVAQESQINDAYRLAQIARDNELPPEGEEDTKDVFKVYSFGTNKSEQGNLVGETVQVLRDLPGRVPFDMVFVEDATKLATDGETRQEVVSFGDGENRYAIESMTTMLRVRKIK